MSILNKQKLSTAQLLIDRIYDILYEMAYNSFDFDILKENIQLQEDTLIIDLRNSELNMDILYFHRLITPRYNIFLEKDILKLTILTRKAITFEVIDRCLDKNTGYKLYFKDGFIINNSIPPNYL